MTMTNTNHHHHQQQQQEQQMQHLRAQQQQQQQYPPSDAIDLESSLGRIEDVDMDTDEASPSSSTPSPTSTPAPASSTSPAPSPFSGSGVCDDAMMPRRGPTKITMFSRPTQDEFNRSRLEQGRVVSPMQSKKRSISSCPAGLSNPLFSAAQPEQKLQRVSDSNTQLVLDADLAIQQMKDQTDEDDFSLTSHEAGSLMDDDTFEFEEIQEDPSSFWLHDMQQMSATAAAAGSTNITRGKHIESILRRLGDRNSPDSQACQVSLGSYRGMLPSSVSRD